MDHLLDEMRDSLGLNHDSKIIPHLHNMLIDGPGQFFEKHQDSEKLQNMIATLVIVLPSPHIGGSLIIEHGKKTYTFSSKNIDRELFKCVAFYANCKHKVKKVKQGHRIALTYNLALESATQNKPPVEKKGSPYKLILGKTGALHEAAQKKFEALTLSRESLASLC